MHSKIGKFLVKTIYMFPVGYLAWIITNGSHFEHPYIPFVAGIGIASLIVCRHVFDYETFDDIKTEDFLESLILYRLQRKKLEPNKRSIEITIYTSCKF